VEAGWLLLLLCVYFPAVAASTSAQLLAHFAQRIVTSAMCLFLLPPEIDGQSV
jgi:hypothetical protein